MPIVVKITKGRTSPRCGSGLDLGKRLGLECIRVGVWKPEYREEKKMPRTEL